MNREKIFRLKICLDYSDRKVPDLPPPHNPEIMTIQSNSSQ